jgi:hypothetical protein
MRTPTTFLALAALTVLGALATEAAAQPGQTPPGSYGPPPGYGGYYYGPPPSP